MKVVLQRFVNSLFSIDKVQMSSLSDAYLKDDLGTVLNFWPID
jgi:hypothetical protein